MNTRCTLAVRAFAFLALLTALFLAPSIGSAQAVDCGRCDHFTIRVGHLNCDLQICYQLTPDTRAICLIVPPGGTVTIPCPAYQAWVNTCSGPHYLVPSSTAARCSPILKFAAGCCGQICVGPSVDRCTALDVTPAPCETAGCP
ncbi:MAG: hypothetical protein JWQ98_3506 [Chlorobi bacterium]|nr:hypothetical protein [Chlorobiota bacterium]